MLPEAQVSGLLVQCSFTDTSLFALRWFLSFIPDRNLPVWGLHTFLLSYNSLKNTMHLIIE